MNWKKKIRPPYKGCELLAKASEDQLFNNLYLPSLNFYFCPVILPVPSLIHYNLQMRPKGWINLCSAAKDPSEIFLIMEMSKDRWNCTLSSEYVQLLR